MPELPDTLVEFELFESNIPLYEVYRILQGWLTEWGGLNYQLTSDLIRERKLDFEETILYLPIIHGSYSKITSKQEDTNDRQDSSN